MPVFSSGAGIDAVAQLYSTPVTFANTNADGTKVHFGVGQTPYYVTSLADTNTWGTLRHALSGDNRLILFEVGGVIKIDPLNGLVCARKNITIAGETAPSPGIILQGGTLYLSRSEQVCIRHVTIECGYDMRQEGFVATSPPTRACNSNGDAIIVQGTGVTRNVWIDHCATFWSNDESIQLWRDGGVGSPAVIENFSITNTIIAEPLYRPETLINPATGQRYKGHWEGGVPERDHNYAVIVGNGVKRIDMQYNLHTEAYWRNPMIGEGVTAVLANIVTVNCRLGAHHGGSSVHGPTKITCTGYLRINGRDSGWLAGPAMKLHGCMGTDYHPDTRVWVSNLYGDRGNTSYPMPDTRIWGRMDSATLSAVEKSLVLPTTAPRPVDIPTAPVKALPQPDLYARTLRNVGPRPKDRDVVSGRHAQPHVQRQFEKLRAKDGKWVNHESEVGGFSKLVATRRSLRNGTGRFRNGGVIPAFPVNHADKAAVYAWLRRFLDEVQDD